MSNLIIFITGATLMFTAMLRENISLKASEEKYRQEHERLIEVLCQIRKVEM